MELHLRDLHLPMRHAFTIAHGTTTVQHNLLVELREDGVSGYGEGASSHAYAEFTAGSMRAALLSPKVVRRFIQRAECKAIVAEHGQHPFPKLRGIIEPLAFDLRTRGFERSPHRVGGELRVGVRRRTFAVSAHAVLAEFDEEVVLHRGRAMRDGERMAHREMKVAEMELHFETTNGHLPALMKA